MDSWNAKVYPDRTAAVAVEVVDRIHSAGFAAYGRVHDRFNVNQIANTVLVHDPDADTWTLGLGYHDPSDVDGVTKEFWLAVNAARRRMQRVTVTLDLDIDIDSWTEAYGIEAAAALPADVLVWLATHTHGALDTVERLGRVASSRLAGETAP